MRAWNARIPLLASHVSLLVRANHPEAIGRSGFRFAVLELRIGFRALSSAAVPHAWHGSVRPGRGSRHRLERWHVLPAVNGSLHGWMHAAATIQLLQQQSRRYPALGGSHFIWEHRRLDGTRSHGGAGSYFLSASLQYRSTVERMACPRRWP